MNPFPRQDTLFPTNIAMIDTLFLRKEKKAPPYGRAFLVKIKSGYISIFPSESDFLPNATRPSIKAIMAGMKVQQNSKYTMPMPVLPA